MKIEECLRGELAEILLLIDAAAPEFTRPQSWAARIVRFFKSAVL